MAQLLPSVYCYREMFPLSQENMREFDNYVLCYNLRLRLPRWVFEHLTPDYLGWKEGDRDKCYFKEDESIPFLFRPRLQDYEYTGYDRGHMAAAENHRWNQHFMDQTYMSTNICPQNRDFNKRMWKDLEGYGRYRTKKANNVWVVTGPIVYPGEMEEDGKKFVKYEVIGNNHVAVPTHFFKVILVDDDYDYKDGEEKKKTLECYVMPNENIPDDKPLREFSVDLEMIEKAAGVIMFPNEKRELLRRLDGNRNPFLEKYQNIKDSKRYKRNTTTEQLVEEKPKWQTIITTIIGLDDWIGIEQLSLSILRGPKKQDGDNGKWMPGSCGFFILLSSNWSSSSIKIDRQIIAVFETMQNKTEKDETINVEFFVNGRDRIKISKPNAVENVHVFKNNQYLFSITEEAIKEILRWFKLMNYIRSHQDAIIQLENEEEHILWKETAKAYVTKTIVKFLVPHQHGVCECNQAIDIINKTCNWEIDKFGTDYNHLGHQDWEFEDKQLSTIIFEVLRRYIRSIYIADRLSI